MSDLIPIRGKDLKRVGDTLEQLQGSVIQAEVRAERERCARIIRTGCIEASKGYTSHSETCLAILLLGQSLYGEIVHPKAIGGNGEADGPTL